MFVTMTLAGLKRTVTQWQVRALEAMGWKQILGASQGVDAVKEDAPLQTSPSRKPRKKKNV
jgi:hypothetical protein